ncbi:MAG: DUF4321 domain-containing protein [Actinobacteria bacterium]|nr:DUF4321 domain-containing protein [Actinomycetota bacterium]
MRKLKGTAAAIVVLAGGVAGSILGEALKNRAPFLANNYSIGFTPTVVNLRILSLTIGFQLKLGVLAIVCMLAAVFIAKLKWW